MLRTVGCQPERYPFYKLFWSPGDRRVSSARYDRHAAGFGPCLTTDTLTPPPLRYIQVNRWILTDLGQAPRDRAPHIPEEVGLAMTRWLAGTLALLMAAVSLVGLAAPAAVAQANAEPLYIGLFAPFTGENAEYG